MDSPTSLLRDWFKWLLFEIGAGYYTRKLAAGPEAVLRREFADFVGAAPGMRVLDVGCGPGHLARWLAQRGCRVTGVDRGWRILRMARQWARREGIEVRFERARGQNLPFAGSSFDLTLATSVIYFVEGGEQVLREMCRVTRPGGTVATLDPDRSMSVASMREYCAAQRMDPADARKLVAWALASEGNRRFAEDELRGLLGRCGLVELHLERRLAGMVWFARGQLPGPPPFPPLSECGGSTPLSQKTITRRSSFRSAVPACRSAGRA